MLLPRMTMCRRVFAFVLFLFLPLVILLPPRDGWAQEPDTAMTDSVEDSSHGASLLDRIGFSADIGAGYIVRNNGYSPGYRKQSEDRLIGSAHSISGPVAHTGTLFQVNSLDVELGVLESTVFDFNYEQTLGQGGFHDRALAFREDRVHGLQKYTFGLDTGPVWYLILPDRSMWLVRRLLALRFRTVRELVQTTGRTDERAFTVANEDAFDYTSTDSPGLEATTSGAIYTFQTRYRYNAVDIPLFYGAGYETAEGSGTFDYWIGTGLAQWTFKRPFATRFSHLGNNAVIYDVHHDALALTAQFELHVRDIAGEEGETGISKYADGGSLVVRYGRTLRTDLTSPDVNLSRLHHPDGQQALDNSADNFETETSMSFALLPNTEAIDIRLTLSGHINLFITRFSNYNNFQQSEIDKLEDGESFSAYEQTDSLLYGKVNMHIGI